MPFVKAHTRNGKPVKAHHRVTSRFNTALGLILMVLLFAYLNKHR